LRKQKGVEVGSFQHGESRIAYFFEIRKYLFLGLVLKFNHNKTLPIKRPNAI
jgi:hypothetical protein